MSEKPSAKDGESGQQSELHALDLPAIQRHVRGFVKERDWTRFHTPKNLVMALSGEVGELTELFQWLTPEESSQVMDKAQSAQRVRDELADVLVYCFRLGDVLGIDLEQAIWTKFKQNAAKYPVELSRGHARKYDALHDDEGK